MLRGFWKLVNNVRAMILAIVVHIIVLGVLMVNMEWTVVKSASKPGVAPVQAQTVDARLVEKELARIQQEKKKKAEEEKRKVEERRLAALEKKRKAEKKKRDAQILEKKRLAEKKAAEKRKKQLAAEAEKKRRIQEQKRLNALKKRRQQETKANSIAQALKDEENQSKIASLISLIKVDIENNWRIPPTAKKGMRCMILIRLKPDGHVQSAQVTKTSGDRVFDRSAEDAVFKASPLPVSVSSAGELFNSTFREFNFHFTPGNL